VYVFVPQSYRRVLLLVPRQQFTLRSYRHFKVEVRLQLFRRFYNWGARARTKSSFFPSAVQFGFIWSPLGSVLLGVLALRWLCSQRWERRCG